MENINSLDNNILKLFDRNTFWWVNLFCILIIFITLTFYKEVDNFISKNLKPSKIQGNLKENGIDWVRLVIFSIPLLILMFIDYNIEDDWVIWSGLKYVINLKNLKWILRILGGYGIVQILAQDMGIKTGKVQRNLIQQPIIQAVLLMSGAYSITGNIDEGFISTLIYLVLKYNVSGNRTSEVCFEDV